MTTLIDRIKNKLYENYYEAQVDEIISIIEAELTVNGVDELISLVDERKKIIDDGIVPTDRIIGYQNCVDGLEKIIKALKQTSVAKEDVGEMGKHIMLQPGEYYKDEFGNIITYEDKQKERLKDSQPKVVEIKDTGVNSFKCKCDNIVEYYNKYCGRCGAKIKWIA